MAKFKVGDRVRVIGAEKNSYALARAIGHEGIIVSADPPHSDPDYIWVVDVPSLPHWSPFKDLPDTQYFARSCDIAPLTPPAADAWATEQVKKWTKPEPAAPTLPVRKLDHA